MLKNKPNTIPGGFPPIIITQQKYTSSINFIKLLEHKKESTASTKSEEEKNTKSEICESEKCNIINEL